MRRNWFKGFIPGRVTRVRCYDFKNISAKKIGVFYSKQSQILKKLTITLVFEKSANFFAENCDHNIGPRLGEFDPMGQSIALGSFF
jgi:hypothetical protein